MFALVLASTGMTAVSAPRPGWGLLVLACADYLPWAAARRQWLTGTSVIRLLARQKSATSHGNVRV